MICRRLPAPSPKSEPHLHFIVASDPEGSGGCPSSPPHLFSLPPLKGRGCNKKGVRESDKWRLTPGQGKSARLLHNDLTGRTQSPKAEEGAGHSSWGHPSHHWGKWAETALPHLQGTVPTRTRAPGRPNHPSGPSDTCFSGAGDRHPAGKMMDCMMGAKCGFSFIRNGSCSSGWRRQGQGQGQGRLTQACGHRRVHTHTCTYACTLAHTLTASRLHGWDPGG